MAKSISSNSNSKGLEKLEKIKADFVTVASHQLRTPISAIRWSLDMLLTGRGGKLTPKQKEYIDQAYYNTDFMARVVSSLLTVSRIEDKGVTIELQNIELPKIVKEVVEKYQPYGKAYNCSLKLNISKKLPKIKTDALQVKKVINNLIDNAIRYSRRASRVVITVKKVKDKILFKIEDSGIGIPKEQHHLVFSKFFRADNAIRAQTEGLGLQLYISKKIIEALGGEIWFESVENEGSTFYFTLPLEPKIKKKEARRVKKITIDEDELEYLYRHITDGLIIVDAKQNIVRVNPVAESFFEIKEKDVIGKNVSKVILNSKILKALKKDEGIKRPFVLKRQKQNYRVVIFPVKTNHRIEGWIIILYDIIKRSKAHEDIDEEIKREREFVAITVHELKSPLGITKWSLEMLQSENPGKLNKEQKELIDQVYRGNERLLVLVRDLLNLSKLQEGRFEIEPKPIHLEQVVDDVVKGFKVNARKKKVKLVWQKKKWPKVLADPNRIGQVINNLVSNAIKYTPSGGTITVTIKKMSTQQLKNLSKKIKTMALTNAKNQKGYLVLTVKDTGMGISPQDQKRLFTKFFRSKDVLKSKTEGTGLGLYITKSIVNLHKGDIWFTSVYKKGSTFSFSLPLWQ